MGVFVLFGALMLCDVAVRYLVNLEGPKEEKENWRTVFREGQTRF